MHHDLTLADHQTLLLCISKSSNKLLLPLKEYRYLVFLVIAHRLSKLLSEHLNLLCQIVLLLLILLADTILVNDNSLKLFDFNLLITDFLVLEHDLLIQLIVVLLKLLIQFFEKVVLLLNFSELLNHLFICLLLVGNLLDHLLNHGLKIDDLLKLLLHLCSLLFLSLDFLNQEQQLFYPLLLHGNDLILGSVILHRLLELFAFFVKAYCKTA